DRNYDGKGGRSIEWRELPPDPATGGVDGFGAIDFKARFKSELGDAAAALCEQAAVFVHRTIVARAPVTLRLLGGSDDGLCLGWNGTRIVHAESERALEAEQIDCEVRVVAGVNHLFAKITQDRGGWEFQIGPKIRLDRAAQAALDWQLDLDFPDAE